MLYEETGERSMEMGCIQAGLGSAVVLTLNVLVQLKCLKTKGTKEGTKEGVWEDRGRARMQKIKSVNGNYSTFIPHVQPLSIPPPQPPALLSASWCCLSRIHDLPSYNLSEYTGSRVLTHPINPEILIGATLTDMKPLNYSVRPKLHSVKSMLQFKVPSDRPPLHSSRLTCTCAQGVQHNAWKPWLWRRRKKEGQTW